MPTMEQKRESAPKSAETTLASIKEAEKKLNEKMMTFPYKGREEYYRLKDEIRKLNPISGDRLHGDHMQEKGYFSATKNIVQKMKETDYGSDLAELDSITELREEAEKQVSLMRQSI